MVESARVRLVQEHEAQLTKVKSNVEKEIQEKDDQVAKDILELQEQAE